MEPDFLFLNKPTQKIKLLDQSGQSMIEFILTFAFSLGILFLFISLGLNFTTGYLAHYATYMSSRTFLVVDNSASDTNSSDQKAKHEAEQVFNTYQLSKFQVMVKGGKVDFNLPGSSEKYEYVGTHIAFTRKLSAFGLLGADQKLELVSESFLGREPTRADCVARICKAMSLSESNLTFSDSSCGSAGSVDITTDDNGC